LTAGPAGPKIVSKTAVLPIHVHFARASPGRDRPHANPAVGNTGTGAEVLAMFGVLGWIIFGLIVGVVAKLIMPGRDPGGFIITILLGVAGALLGGWIGRALGLYGPEDAAGFLMALAGSILLLVLYRMFVGRRTTVVR
jgi:uncharacterized membrane protein YeaQ/YmgE (transglycosylase-associated protein family)